MAKIENLIAEISDQRLQNEIAGEVSILKKHKKFGLVFEEHIPETIQLPTLPIKIGSNVVKRSGNDKGIYLVEEIINYTKARISRINGGKTEECVDLQELIIIKRFGEPIYPSLIPVDRLSLGGDKPYHSIINAENYHALQLLLYCYEGCVDVIYIDPPYNKEGRRDWKYNNDFVDSTDQYRHSKWLSMMKRRLLLAKRLLKKDGVLIVTIDENEIHHLGMLLEEIFPEYLRHTLTTVINPKGTGKLNFARMDEYIIFCVPQVGYSLVSGNFVPFLSRPVEDEEFDDDIEDDLDEEIDDETEEKIDLSKIAEKEFPFPKEDIDLWELRHSRRRGSESSYRSQRWHQFYPIYIDLDARRVIRVGDSLPLGLEPSFEKVDGLTPVWPIDDEGNHRCWRFIPNTMQQLIDEGKVILGTYNKKRNTWTLNIWELKSKNKRVKSVWWHSRHDSGTHGTSLLHKIFGRRDAFSFPKSLYVVHDTLSTVCGNRPDALIVDFFAGSGTTYHATALLNSEDGGRRRCILVTNNEVNEKIAKKLNQKNLFPGDSEFEKFGICESVTWPRCKFVTQGHRDDGTPLQGKYLNKDDVKKGVAKKFNEGFAENLEYFHLDFLDPNDVAYGEKFESILPILWLMANSRGERSLKKITENWYIPERSPYAVLINEHAFSKFFKAISKRIDLTHIFLVTDSEEAFYDMSSQIPKTIRTKMLYKSYLDNFLINTERTL